MTTESQSSDSAMSQSIAGEEAQAIDNMTEAEFQKLLSDSVAPTEAPKANPKPQGEPAPDEDNEETEDGEEEDGEEVDLASQLTSSKAESIRLKQEIAELKKHAAAKLKEAGVEDPDFPDATVSQETVKADFQRYNEAFWDNGYEVPEAMVAEISEKYNIPPEFVATHVAATKAAVEQFENQITAEVPGGRDQLVVMQEWAATNMSPTAIEAYNLAFRRNDLEGAKLMLGVLQSQYEAANGSLPAKATNPSRKPASKSNSANVDNSADVFNNAQEYLAAEKEAKSGKGKMTQAELDKKLMRTIKAGVDIGI